MIMIKQTWIDVVLFTLYSAEFTNLVLASYSNNRNKKVASNIKDEKKDTVVNSITKEAEEKEHNRVDKEKKIYLFSAVWLKQ